MKVIALLGAIAAVLAVTSVGSAEAQGFKSSFTLDGLQRFEAAIVAFVNSQFQDVSLPDMHLESKVPIVGHVNIDLTNIVITGFNIPGATFTLTPPNTVAAGVSGTGLTVKLNWHWKQKSWPHTSDHGDLTAVPKQGNINAAIAIAVDGAGRVHLTAASTSADFNKIELHFSGHWDSWLYNFLTDLFSSTIRHTVDSAVASALTGVINNSLNNALAKLPTQLVVGGGHSRMDIDIPWTAITAQSTYLELANEFGVRDNSTGASCPFSPAPLPDLDPQSHQLQFFLAASALNCAVWVPYTNGAIHFHYPSTVAFWAEFIPQLQQMYPGDQLLTDIFPLFGQPNITMTSNGVFGSMSFSMNQSAVTSTGAMAYTDTLRADASFGIDLWVGPSKTTNNTNDLFGSVSNVKLDVGVLDSVIGTIDLTNLQLIIDVALPLVTDVLNGVLGAGIPLPLVPFIQLVNPQVVFGDGYFGIATDFNFGDA